VSALGHYLEDEGIPTVAISLIRLHSEKIRGPRALWVPFELGRPFGAPQDPLFQSRVLTTALGLLESAAGPVVLEDFAEQAPGASDDPAWRPHLGAGAALPRTPPSPDALRSEVSALAASYREQQSATGRTTVGVSGLTIEACVETLAAALAGAPPPHPQAALPAVQVLRFAVDDLKAYYLEALAAGAGTPSSAQMQNWFWDTATGRAIVALRAALLTSEDKRSQAIGRGSLVPRAQLERLGLG